MKMLYSLLFFSVVINIILNISATFDCNYYVKTGSNIEVTYKGCKDTISTEGVDNATSPTADIYSFKGIPFAEPPMRFQKPVLKIYSENTTIDATNFGNPCMQLLPVDFPILPSENCLYLNVWTPTLNKSSKLPVMLWIYGGSFAVGSGNQFFFNSLSFQLYHGSYLALRDVIVVTFNYRLGVWGFLYANRTDAPGNVGIWDQAMALNWTRQNIEAFGGDPNRITLFGESAGSISCSMHIVSPITRNLFQRAIMQSGSAYIKANIKDKNYMYGISRKYASNAFILGNCDNDINWFECLLEKSPLELLIAQSAASVWNADQPYPLAGEAPFLPIFGDELIPISVNEAVKIGKFKIDIEMLIGHNEMDGLINPIATQKGVLDRYNPQLPTILFLTKTQVQNDIKEMFVNYYAFNTKVAENYTEGLNDLTFRIFPENPNINLIRRSAAYCLADFYLTCSTVLFGGHISKNMNFTGKVYQYRLTHIHRQSTAYGSVWFEATHTDDLALVFGLPDRPIQRILFNDADRKMSREMMYIWTNFAKFGVPPKVNGKVWPPYSRKLDGSSNATYLELNADNSRLGRVFTNRYRGNDVANHPKVIQNCFEYWDDILSGQF